MAYQQLLAHLFGRSARGMRLGLEPIAALLARLGHPERRLPAVIVAGTNGKGSVSHLTAAALVEAGHRVGLFTSPHLLQVTERMQVNNVPLSREALAELYDELCVAERPLERPATFFESTLALALMAFERARVDVCVLEVGLGGRLDAVNVTPDAMRLATAITPIALDHQQVLGHTLSAIAAEKLAIARAGVPLISAQQAPEVMPLVVERARAVGAPLTWAVDAQVTLAIDASAMPPYRRDNVALSLAVTRALRQRGTAVSDAQFARAATRAVWPGRYQWLPQANGPQVLLDCAHNVAGAAALALALGDDARVVGRKVIGLIGAMADKDLAQMLCVLRPRLAQLHLTPIAAPRSMSRAELQSIAPDAQVHDNFHAAFSSIAAHAAPEDVVVIAGSVYLVGAALTHITHAPCDPPV